MTVRALLQLVLFLLATYHAVIGILSVSSLPAASRAVSALYGVQLGDNPQLRYAVRMLGLYALALGALLAIAAMRPETHRSIIVVAGLLQLARGVSRLAFRHDLVDAFGVSPRQNLAATLILFVEAAVLLGATYSG